MIKTILLLVLMTMVTSFYLKDQKCYHELEVECIDIILSNAYPACLKTAQEKDQQNADLKCMKFLTPKKCWDCICYITNFDRIVIDGC